MGKEKYNFQICQKLVVMSRDRSSVLLCKRANETDMDGIFTFIGGKMENSDESIIEALRREKNEEVGEGFRVNVLPSYSWNARYLKKDGKHMMLPHYLAFHIAGEVDLNEEYSEYKWVGLDKLEDFEPKVDNIPFTVGLLLLLERIADDENYTEI